MKESKFGKYILTELKIPEGYGSPSTEDNSRSRLLFLDNSIIPGAFYLSAAWYLKDSDKHVPPPSHTHGHDEIIAFFGSNAEDPHDLGGELEIWLGGEQHFTTKSCLVFIPKGLSHCPFWVRNIKRPILHFSTAPMGSYVKKEIDEK
jgi:hypothetical protein